MKKAGIAAVVVGILLMIGSLYVARTVQNSAIITQMAKVVNVEVNRENAGKLLDVILYLTDENLEDAEKVAKVGERLEVEYSERDAKLILGRANKLLAGGLDSRSRLCLQVHPADQVLNVAGLVLVVAGGAMIIFGGKLKKA